MAWAKSPDPAPTPIDRNRFLKKLAFMESTLPSKAIDTDAGKERTTVYLASLGHYPEDAIAWMVKEACQRLDWFPTVKQCLALLAEYDRKRPPTEKTLALMDSRKFIEQRFETWLGWCKDGDIRAIDIVGIPDHWKRVAVERGFLKVEATDDGPVYSIRAQRVAQES